MCKGLECKFSHCSEKGFQNTKIFGDSIAWFIKQNKGNHVFGVRDIKVQIVAQL